MAGTGGRTRTGTTRRSGDFESPASTKFRHSGTALIIFRKVESNKWKVTGNLAAVVLSTFYFLLVTRYWGLGTRNPELNYAKLPPMKTILTILIVVAGGWLLLMVVLKGIALYLRKNTLKAVQKILAGEKILHIADNTSFLGADFPGPNLPPRTSGVLAVTDRQIYFLPWFPRKKISLPWEWIKGVKLESSYGSVTAPIPCLVIQVRDLKDPEGTIAWLVHEPSEWLKVIKGQLGKR